MYEKIKIEANNSRNNEIITFFLFPFITICYDNVMDEVQIAIGWFFFSLLFSYQLRCGETVDEFNKNNYN